MKQKAVYVHVHDHDDENVVVDVDVDVSVIVSVDGISNRDSELHFQIIFKHFPIAVAALDVLFPEGKYVAVPVVAP
ncbi:MAG TPA: hypothetical protein VGL91_21135 [Acidobacteriota bacterium]